MTASTASAIDAASLKRQAARAAIAYVAPGAPLGVGTGSTVNAFIDALGESCIEIDGAVSSSESTSARLRALGIRLIDANQVESLPVYVDGCDEIDGLGRMIKGGGAALTREKIVADLAERFVCIADGSKLVETLGRFALPIEVIPMATARIARRLRALGGAPVLRRDVVTDNGGVIIDVHGLAISDPLALEIEINQWPGVVAVGLFARRKADVCLIGVENGVKTLQFDSDAGFSSGKSA